MSKGFVYFIQAAGGGPVKIGYSSSRPGVFERLKSLQTGHPERLRLLATREAREGQRSEWLLHRQYRAGRLNGEWFALTDEDLRELDLRDAGAAGQLSLIPIEQAREHAARARHEARADVVAGVAGLIANMSETFARIEPTISELDWITNRHVGELLLVERALQLGFVPGAALADSLWRGSRRKGELLYDRLEDETLDYLRMRLDESGWNEAAA